MDIYYTDFIWKLDAAFFYLAAALALISIAYLIISRRIEKKRYLHQMKLIARLKRFPNFDNNIIRSVCAAVVRKTTPFEFYDIAKYRDNIYPQRLSGQFNECLIDSGKVDEAEAVAWRSKSKWRRIEAIISVGHLRSPKALTLLSETLFNKDEDVKYFSLLALSYIKTDDAAAVILEALRQKVFSGELIASLLINFPSTIIVRFVEALGSSDTGLRLWAVKLLTKFKAEQDYLKVLALIDDPLLDVRSAVCEYMGELKIKAAEEKIRSRLADNAWQVRIQAVLALEKINGPDCLKDIENLLKDDNWYVRDSVQRIMTKYLNGNRGF